MNQEEKWNKHFQQSETEAIAANEVLQQYTHLLPESGKALDFACGLGGNAMLLANSGLDTYAWDISTIALDKLETLAKKSRLNLTTEARDIELRPPEPNCFDVIVVGK
ncbi:MAG: methyltransferase domain-containing protein, partial [Pseudomonadota bacterium]